MGASPRTTSVAIPEGLRLAAYAVRLPSRYLPLALALGGVIASTAGVGTRDANGDMQFSSWVTEYLMFASGVSILVILVGWRRFWMGPAVVRLRIARKPGASGSFYTSDSFHAFEMALSDSDHLRRLTEERVEREIQACLRVDQQRRDIAEATTALRSWAALRVSSEEINWIGAESSASRIEAELARVAIATASARLRAGATLDQAVAHAIGEAEGRSVSDGIF